MSDGTGFFSFRGRSLEVAVHVTTVVQAGRYKAGPEVPLNFLLLLDPPAEAGYRVFDQHGDGHRSNATRYRRY